MGRRFVPVPYDALACCSRMQERECVRVLYERAHGFRWQPFSLSVRSFAEPGGLGVGAALDLLRALEDAGLVSRTHNGSRVRADTITVHDPTADLAEHLAEHRSEHCAAAVGADRSRAPEQVAEHKSERARDQRGVARVGDHDHDSLSLARDDTPPPATDLRNPGGLDPAAGYPAALWSELVRSCLEEAGVVPLGGKLSQQEAKAAAQIARDHPSREAVMRTLRWILDSADPAAKRARKQIDERRLRFVLTDWPEYDRAAQQDEQRPRAPPPKPRPTDDEVFGPLIPRRPPPRPE